MRLTKLCIEPGNGPGQFVGTGHYDYVVSVYLGPGWQLFEGRKPAEGDRVRWIINLPQ